jgi:hypothetical protein
VAVDGVEGILGVPCNCVLVHAEILAHGNRNALGTRRDSHTNLLVAQLLHDFGLTVDEQRFGNEAGGNTTNGNGARCWNAGLFLQEEEPRGEEWVTKPAR